MAYLRIYDACKKYGRTSGYYYDLIKSKKIPAEYDSDGKLIIDTDKLISLQAKEQEEQAKRVTEKKISKKNAHRRTPIIKIGEEIEGVYCNKYCYHFHYRNCLKDGNPIPLQLEISGRILATPDCKKAFFYAIKKHCDKEQ